MYILAIDPGSKKSAYVAMRHDLSFDECAIVENETLLDDIWSRMCSMDRMVVEKLGYFGGRMGKDCLDTAFWIGRFVEAYGINEGQGSVLLHRKTIVTHMCGVATAGDSAVRSAVISRYAEITGSKASAKEYLKEVKRDIWSALAIGITFFDMDKLQKTKHTKSKDK